MTPAAIIRRLWRKTRIDESGCWIREGAERGGYARLRVDKVYWDAHVLSFTIFHGPVPEGKRVLHRCDVRNCWNPDHLWDGTQKDNVQDAADKGRLWAQQPENQKERCVRGHLRTSDNVDITKGRRASCKICRRASGRAAYHRRKAQAAGTIQQAR